jgi:hypothetical protein
MPSYGMLRRVALVRTDVSEEPSASIIRVTRIGELRTTLASLATDARCEEILFFILIAVKTSNLTTIYCLTQEERSDRTVEKIA